MSSASAEYNISDSMATKVIQFLDKELLKTHRRAIPMPEVYASFKADLGDLEQYRFTSALSKAAKSGRLGKYDVLRGKAGGLGIPKKAPKDVGPVKEAEPVETEDVSFKVTTIGQPEEEAAPKKGDAFREMVVRVGTPPSSMMAVANPVDTVPSESPALVPPPVVPTVLVPAPKKEPVKMCTLMISGREYQVPETESTIRTILTKVFECKECGEDSIGQIELCGSRFSCDDQALHYLANFVFCSMNGHYILRGEGHNHNQGPSQNNVFRFPERKNHGDSSP